MSPQFGAGLVDRSQTAALAASRREPASTTASANCSNFLKLAPGHCGAFTLFSILLFIEEVPDFPVLQSVNEFGSWRGGRELGGWRGWAEF